jgi:hypothetical protein
VPVTAARPAAAGPAVSPATTEAMMANLETKLDRLGKQHVLTNRVRHAFEVMDPEEAAAATHLFVTFCRLAGIDACQQVHLQERYLRYLGRLSIYTRALARYSRYISEIKAMRIAAEIFSTVDGLFFRKLQMICPDAKYDFDLLESWVTPQLTPLFLTPEELARELENFLFAEGISEKEYLEKIVPRTGMRRRLSAQQRQVVWRIRRKMAAEMEERNTYTKNYGRLKVLEHLLQHPQDRQIRDIDLLFLDEVQDLNPVALRSLAAADPEAAPDGEAAEGQADAPADPSRPFPFREGPLPELYSAASTCCAT